MKRTHGQLCTGLTDTLRRHDADRFTQTDGTADAQIPTVTPSTDAAFHEAGQGATQRDRPRATAQHNGIATIDLPVTSEFPIVRDHVVSQDPAKQTCA